ncbi:MAG: tRNA glutamyl-Q(34) synthetase GluQRS [Marivibrio sp.]|uniref:tRNA glutamyl-Q(34) synthetase GluQRS n=1 Tax=Marivibrio sp. TaxID=2039719 RepID=UPI0032EFEAAA
MRTDADPSPPVTRFAPSPTGRLHLGHAYSALVAAQAAEEAGGTFLLRLEDIDQGRARAEYEAGIIQDLRWLGIDWPEPVRRQSEHFELYREFLHALEEGGVAYPCFCTRKEIQAEIAASDSAPHGPDGPLYPGTCKGLSRSEIEDRLAEGRAYAVRLDMTKAARMAGPLSFADRRFGTVAVDPESCGDVVLARKDAPASYHLCVTVDDALQGVTLVTRGEDLLHATHIHRILQTLLGLPEPRYHHHPLLTDESGKRLAKRADSESLQALRQAGWTPAQVRAEIAGRAEVAERARRGAHD